MPSRSRKPIILLDYDGVIVNSDDFNRETIRRAAKSLDISLPSNTFERFFAGRSLRDGTRALVSNYDLGVSPEEFIRAKASFDDIYIDTVDVYEDAKEFLKVTGGRARLGLVTGSRRSLVDRFFSKHHMDGLFESIVSSEDVKRGKPAPDPYLLVLAQMRIKKSIALAIEDSPSGVQSARSAGIYCLAITHTHSAEVLREASAVASRLCFDHVSLLCRETQDCWM